MVMCLLVLLSSSAASSFASFDRKCNAIDTKSIQIVKSGQHISNFRGGEGERYHDDDNDDDDGRGSIIVDMDKMDGSIERGSSIGKILSGVTVIITAPESYAPRLASFLESAGATILSCPAVTTEFINDENNTHKNNNNNNRKIDDTNNSDDLLCLSDAIHDISTYDYIAFTSRKGIEAALRVGGEHLVMALNGDPHHDDSDIEIGSKPATTRLTRAIALGADAQALIDAGVQASNVLIPESPTPDGIVQCLLSLHKPTTAVDENSATAPSPCSSSSSTSSSSSSSSTLSFPPQHLRILCPIPRVTGGLSEPPVVPNFLACLRRAGNGDWQVQAVDAYITKWTGPSTRAARVMNILRRFTIDDENNGDHHNSNKLQVLQITDNNSHDDSTVEQIIVIAISSTAEVEGLLKLCDYYGVNLLESLKNPSTCYPSQHDTLDTKQDAAVKTASLGKGGRIKIAAHGPVTAHGIESFLGVAPTAISQSSSSFQGMIAAVAECCGRKMTTDDI